MLLKPNAVHAAVMGAVLLLAGAAGFPLSASPEGKTHPQAESHAVDLVFAEPLNDPCKSLLLTWSSTSADADAIEYRLGGEDHWRRGSSHRSRPFPGLDDLYLHTATLSNLGPDTEVQLRFPGASRTETVKTPPEDAVRIVVASDYQRSDSGESSQLARFGSLASGMDCDLLIFAGDFVNDNGKANPEMAKRWLGFMSALGKYWRRDGCLIPVLGVLGNHEGHNQQNTSNAHWRDTGTVGPMEEIFSLGFDRQSDGYVNRGLWTCGIGGEVFIISLETDHTIPLPPQTGWLEEQLEVGAENYRHVIVVGHSPAFYVYWKDWEAFKSQAGTLQGQFWPLMQKHADKVRGYFCGHEHRLALTERLRVDEVSGGLRLRVDPVGGVRQIGSGSIAGGMGPLNPKLTERTAEGPDGETAIFKSAGGHEKGDPAAYETYGQVKTDGSSGMHHVWIADFSANGFEVQAVGDNGHRFCALSETFE